MQLGVTFQENSKQSSEYLISLHGITGKKKNTEEVVYQL